jgi:hypothetical protein
MVRRGRRCKGRNNAKRGTQKAREGTQSKENSQIKRMGFQSNRKKPSLREGPLVTLHVFLTGYFQAFVAITLPIV